MNNNNGYGYAGGFGPLGYAAAPPEQHAPKFQNALTPEEINSIRARNEQFSLAISKEDQLKGLCTHRDVNGNESLIANADGKTVTCAICGKVFEILQISDLEVAARTEEFLDVLQTIKLLYLDLPTEAAREYFQIIPLIEKIPGFYELATKNFLKHERWQTNQFNGNPNTVNLYNMLSGGGLGQMMYQQQMGGYQQPMGGYQQPMGGYPQQMYQQPMGGYQQPMGGSPFFNGPAQGYAQPQQQYAPQNPGYQYAPNQQAAQQCAPSLEAPVTSTATTDGSKVEVNAQFQS